MKLYTEIEINEIDTEVMVDYEMQFGEPVITLITDVHTGDAIAPDLLGQAKTADLLDALREDYADYQADKRNSKRVNYITD